MTLSTTWTLVNNDDFRGRVIVAVYKSAVNILNGTDPVDSPRYRLAREAKDQATMLVTSFIWDVSSNASIELAAATGQEEVPDGDIEFVVAALWDSIAMLRYPPPPVAAPVTTMPYIPPPDKTA